MAWPNFCKLLVGCRHRRYFAEESRRAGITIIVPLYIYPDPGSWNPLYESIERHPKKRFLVVVNPGNGPGPQSVPDTNYLREIPKLARYRNVDVVGYVHTSFAQRNLTTVMNDIDTYSRWSDQARHPGLGISGIFVDETPNEHYAYAEDYLRQVTDFTKGCTGFRGNKLVIHNPGCAPSPAYMALADLTVVFEDTWQVFNTRLNEGVFDLQRLFNTSTNNGYSKATRNSLAVMIHSVPRDLGAEQSKAVVQRAKQAANVMFITDLDTNYYSNWSPQWSHWVTLAADP